MSEEFESMMYFGDEALDAPSLEASQCAVSFVCACVGISDEALDAPVMEAGAPFNVCVAPCNFPCQISDEALDAPEQQAAARCSSPCLFCTVSDEARASL